MKSLSWGFPFPWVVQCVTDFKSPFFQVSLKTILLKTGTAKTIPAVLLGPTLVMYTSSTAAINVTKVTVDIPPSDDAVIPVVLDLQDDSIVEPTDFYQLTIDNVSDPNIIVDVVNITFIIVNDDDVGKM